MTDSAEEIDDQLALLDEVIKAARKAGADAADALIYQSASLEASFRLGAREDLERSESKRLGLRAFIGQRQAAVSSNDVSKSAQAEMIERVVAMARAAPEDPYCGLAESGLLCHEIRDLDLYDEAEPTPEALYQMAERAEDAARAVEGVSNSEGGGGGWGRVSIALATSGGFFGGYRSSSHSIYASVLAGEGTEMERDYDHHSSHHLADLEDAGEIGRKAGEKAVARLNPRKVESQAVPVVFDPRVSRGIVGHLASAINGSSVARGTSFLKDKLGEMVLAKGLNVIDDPHRPRGLASKPFDGEGVENGAWTLVEDGRLTTWLLDTASARQLGMTTRGHASRGAGGPPSPSTSNLYLAAGEQSPAELMAEITSGFYVTELIGFGVNQVTGDYSRGASGFWIENGELGDPVSELTIAGNLVEMFGHLSAADDLEFRYGTNAPTLRIDGMMVAGA